MCICAIDLINDCKSCRVCAAAHIIRSCNSSPCIAVFKLRSSRKGWDCATVASCICCPDHGLLHATFYSCNLTSSLPDAGANLASYLRMRYPDVIAGAVCSSAVTFSGYGLVCCSPDCTLFCVGSVLLRMAIVTAHLQSSMHCCCVAQPSCIVDLMCSALELMYSAALVGQHAPETSSVLVWCSQPLLHLEVWLSCFASLSSYFSINNMLHSKHGLQSAATQGQYLCLHSRLCLHTPSLYTHLFRQQQLGSISHCCTCPIVMFAGPRV